MPAPTPDDENYDHGNVRTADDIRRVGRELIAPRDIVPVKPDRGAWDRTAAAAGQRDLTLTEHTMMFDVDGVPNGIDTRKMPAGELGRPPGYPMLSDDARCVDPRVELGDEYDPEIDGPIPA